MKHNFYFESSSEVAPTKHKDLLRLPRFQDFCDVYVLYEKLCLFLSDLLVSWTANAADLYCGYWDKTRPVWQQIHWIKVYKKLIFVYLHGYWYF